MKIGIIGLGYWGPNLVRNFLSQNSNVSVICCDMNAKRLEAIKKKFPMVETATDYKILLQDPSVTAVAIVTPVSSHFPIAKEALEAGKHVLVEKPLTDSVENAQTLIELAEKKKLTLMVDHTFIYNSAVRKIKEIVDKDDIGDVLYFDSVRVNLGLFQHDINVIWDLAPHDISIMNYIARQKAVAVSAIGARHFNDIEDVAYLTVFFPNNRIAHFHVNWISPVKIRKILIGGSKKMIVYDDMESSEKVKIYNKGVDVQSEEMVHKMLVQYRMGDMYAPNLDQTEALYLMCGDFIDSILNNKKPESDGEAGLDVVKILAASQTSLNNRSAIISLD